MSGYKSNMWQLRNEIHTLKEQYHNKLNTKCYQLKIHSKAGEDSAEFVQTAILDRIKLTESQWRTLDFWEILQSVNPCPLMKFSRDELFKLDSTLQEDKRDIVFRWSIVLCSMFENLMETLGWKVGDTLDIEEDICDVVGHLMIESGKPRHVEFVGLHATCNYEHSSEG